MENNREKFLIIYIKQLRTVLKELSEWWDNWMPDDAYEEGGQDILERVKIVLSLQVLDEDYEQAKDKRNKL